MKKTKNLLLVLLVILAACCLAFSVTGCSGCNNSGTIDNSGDQQQTEGNTDEDPDDGSSGGTTDENPDSGSTSGGSEGDSSSTESEGSGSTEGEGSGSTEGEGSGSTEGEGSGDQSGENPSEELDYTLSDDKNYYTVSGIGTVTSTKIEIPATHNGVPVTVISANAFKGNTIIIIIIISDNVTEIGANAFNGCTSLKTVTMGSGVKIIGESAFSGCTALSTVTFGSNVQTIGQSAFSGCSSLTRVTIPASVTAIGENAFANCVKIVIIVISGDTTIGKNAFAGCGQLTDLTVSDELLDRIYDIIKSAFPDSTGLTDVKSGEAENAKVYHAHELIHNQKVAATCTESGTAENWYCSICDKYFSDENGSIETTAANLVLTATGHTNGEAVVEKKVEATCTENGSYDTVIYCTVCNKELSRETTITTPATGHTWNGGEVTTESTCTKEGVKTYTCIVCGGTYTEAIATTKHSYNSSGICAVCGAELIGSEGLKYTISSDGTYYTVSGIGECTTTDIIIPYKYNGISVTAIAASAFSGNTTITSVYISDSVTSIGSKAFYGCTSLTNITIGKGVTTISTYAFYNCTKFTEINFNATAMSDLYSGNYVFSYAGQSGDGITVTIGSNVTKIPAYLFYPYYRSGYDYSPKITSVVFEKDSVCTSIGSHAFSYCTSLTSITIPDGVTTIGGYAFYNCTALTEINFNATAMSDLSSSNYVFYCAGQSGKGITVTIGAYVTKIPAYLFYSYSSSSYAPKIISIVFEEGNVCTSIGNYAFYYCSKLTSITMPDSVTTIGTYAFSCSSLTSITIPESVTTIGTYAFSGCTKLTEINFNATALSELSYNSNVFSKAGQSGDGITVTIGANVTKLPDYLFCPDSSSSSAPKITSVVFEDNSVCTSMGRYAFCGCSSLTSITIPDNVTTIGSSAFSGCTALTEINFNATAMEDLSSHNYVFYNAGQSGKGITVTIGANVTKLPDYLFCPDSSSSSAPKITSVVFEDNSVCTSMGRYAFCGCSSLTSITIPDNVTTIGSSAFYGCTKLTSVTMGSGVTTISSSAFYNCTSLTSITIGDSVTTIGTYAFYNCTSITSITIGDSVTTIGYDAFYNCTKLTSITIGDSVTTIGNNAFYNTAYYNDSNNWTDNVLYIGTCLIKADTSISESYKIKEGTTVIAMYAFYNCTSLTSITIPDSVTTIGGSAFHGCTLLKSVYYIGTASQWANILFSDKTAYPLYYAGGNLYFKGTLATDISIEGIVAISEYAFYNCSSLTSITIPDSVTSIGEYAFYNCTSIKTITLPDSVTTIGGYAFYGCTSLTSVTIPDSVTTISAYVFYDCSSLTSITIPDSVISIGERAFCGCTSLKSITIPDSVITIGNYAFSGCTSLKSITIGKGITSIGMYAFSSTAYYNDSNNWTDNVLYVGNYLVAAKTSILGSYKIKEGTTVIAMHAFYNCTSLTSITIPDSVTTIGGSAFHGCTSLTSVTIGNGVTTINDEFYGCTSLTSVIIGSGVTTIGSYAFWDCYSIKSVYYKGTASEWSAISIGSNAGYITIPTRYYYAESGSTTVAGNYWYYDNDGNIKTWSV